MNNAWLGNSLATGSEWLRKNPAQAFLLASITATLVYFFGFVELFVKGTFVSGLASTATWAWQAWQGETQAHSKLVPLIALGVVWYHREAILKAPKRGANSGLIFVAIGVALFVLGARCLQPRLALAAMPFLIFGSVLYVWGYKVGRIVLFPCAFLFFLIPVAVIEQATFRLQFIITGIVGFLSNLFGIRIDAVGTTLTAADGSFDFQIAEGCSGIRSLTAMTMISAVYVHITQKRQWKKFTIFGLSVLFAIVGNAGRIFTVVLFAKFIDPKMAAGIYHDYSGYVFFPIAIMAMLGFSKLINMDIGRLKSAASQRETEPVKYDY